jgi:uncharacterized protein (DUF2252 family)
MAKVVDAIRDFNSGRDPERLAMKYKAMRANPFVFLRGTCHLFYARLPRSSLLRKVPPAWVCGDLHLENFGSYRGDNRLRYFDINDFDEAALAPLTWDPVRLMTSMLVAAETLKLPEPAAVELCETFTSSYAAALADGKARWIERDMATGLIGALLESLNGRDQASFLDRRTEIKKRRRVLRCDGRHALSASEPQHAFVTDIIDRHAEVRDQPNFFKVLDVARRVAGTGSLGLERYIVLVEGKASPNGNQLLDLKATPPSALSSHLVAQTVNNET